MEPKTDKKTIEKQVRTTRGLGGSFLPFWAHFGLYFGTILVSFLVIKSVLVLEVILVAIWGAFGLHLGNFLKPKVLHFEA